MSTDGMKSFRFADFDLRWCCKIEEVAFQNLARQEALDFTFHGSRPAGGVGMNTTRRDFLKVGAGAVAATSAVSASSGESFSSLASGRSAAAPAGDEGNM